MSGSSVRKILVVGATGKQGGAVIKALLASPPSFPHEILAVTRKATSSSAQALAAKPNVKIVEGDLDDCPKIFEAAGGKDAVWGAFLVTLPSMKKLQEGVTDKEVVQGCAFIDTALENGVKHIVFSSVDRGGDVKSWKTATLIPHFITKHEIELHLKRKAEADTSVSYTVLRPVAFMDNLTPTFFGRMFAAAWAQMGDKKLQLVATTDIGIFAAKALSNSDAEEFKNEAIGLAGDDLTQAEGNEAMWKAMRRPMTQTYWGIASFIQWMVADVGIMFNWFKTDGYGSDIEKCRKIHPGMMDFQTWLKQESKF